MLKRVIFRISAVLIGCTFIFSMLEIGLRVFNPQRTGPVQFGYDPDLGCVPVPSQKGIRTRPDYSFTNNAWGLRGAREYNKEKTTDFRILVLGDSFTYGLGVNDEQVFTVLLEKNLSRSGRSVEVINAGIPGKGTDYALKFMQTRGLELDPDLVILCFNRTDYWDNERADYYTINSDGSVSAKILSNSVCAKKIFLVNSAFYNWLVSWSHLANLFRNYATNIIAKWQHKPGENCRGRTIISYPAEGGYDRQLTLSYIELLNKEVKKSGAVFLVFYVGECVEVDLYRRKGMFSDCEKDFREMLQDLDVANFSLTEVVANTDLATQAIYNMDTQDNHFSVNGHIIFADYMGDCLEAILHQMHARNQK